MRTESSSPAQSPVFYSQAKKPLMDQVTLISWWFLLIILLESAIFTFWSIISNVLNLTESQRIQTLYRKLKVSYGKQLVNKLSRSGQVWCCTPWIQALRQRQRQADLHDCEASLVNLASSRSTKSNYILRPCLKNITSSVWWCMHVRVSTSWDPPGKL